MCKFKLERFFLTINKTIEAILFLFILSLPLDTAHAYSQGVALKEFQTAPGPIEFLGASARHDIYVPIYAREMLESIDVELTYTNSVSLLPDISQIIVLADEFVVGQAAISGTRAGGRNTFIIPAELLNSDTMRLSIKVNQHYDTDCENPLAKQLWTHVNPVKSRLVFNWKARPGCTTLRKWFNMLSPSNPFLEEAVIVVPETGMEWIESASDIAAWLASVRQYRHLYLRISNSIVPGLPNIIIGPEEFARKKIENVAELFEREGKRAARAELPGPISGPAAALFNIEFPDGSRSCCLAVTGPDADQARTAASSLAVVQQNWPENRLMLLDTTKPSLPPYSRACLRPEKEYTFRELGLYSNMNFEGMGVKEKSLSIYVPPELYRQENIYAKLHLDLIYSAGLREDSSLHINVNSTLAGSIGLNNPEGQAFSNYLINIPMSFFRPGHNALSFKVIMKPFRAQKCAPVGQESMVTAILDSSELSIPSGFEHYRLPDIALLMDDMFPISLGVEKGETPHLVIPDPTDINIFEAAVNFSAMFASRLHTPFNYLSFTTGLPEDSSGDTVFLSTISGLPADLKAEMPAFGSGDRLEYMLPGTREEVMELKNSITDSRLILTELEFPPGSTQTAFVITALSSPAIRNGMELIAGSGASMLHGDTALVDTETKNIRSYSLNRKYQRGRLGLQGPAGNWLTSRPEYYYPILGAVVFITAISVLYLIRRRRKMRETS